MRNLEGVKHRVVQPNGGRFFAIDKPLQFSRRGDIEHADFTTVDKKQRIQSNDITRPARRQKQSAREVVARFIQSVEPF